MKKIFCVILVCLMVALMLALPVAATSEGSKPYYNHLNYFELVNAEANGTKVLICAAGMAAHLAGVIAGHTVLPVIGIPMASAPFNGLDSLLAMVQMPPGIPVATVTAGNAGGKNAALLAIQMLALSNPELMQKLKDFRIKQAEKVLADDKILRESGYTSLI